MIRINIKKADRLIEIIESMPEPVVKIDYENNKILAHNKNGIVLKVFNMSIASENNKIVEYLIKNDLYKEAKI